MHVVVIGYNTEIKLKSKANRDTDGAKFAM